MNENYIKLISRIKKLNNKYKEEKKENIFLDDIGLSKQKDNIIFLKEYNKLNVTFGVVCLLKKIITPIDYSNIEKIDINEINKYDTKIIIIDNTNEIDNIMYKRFENKDDALEYANILSKMIEENSFDTIVEKIYNSLS